MTADRDPTRVSIDAGQSSVRVRVNTREELTFPGIRTDRSPVEQVASLLARHDGWGAASVAVGLTGYNGSADAPALVLAATPTAHVAAVAHDSVTGYLGANGRSDGVVAAGGPGGVGRGGGPPGGARGAGWGARLGGAGSADGIGRAGLEAVLRAYDGRGEKTSLTPVVESTFGTPLSVLYLEIQADPDRVARVASLAPAVTQRADEDPVCSRIVGRAADELADSIVAALRRAGVDPSTGRLSGTGRVLASRAVTDRLARRLAARVGGAGWDHPLGEPIDGVGLLHDLCDDHPLAGSVAVAARRAH